VAEEFFQDFQDKSGLLKRNNGHPGKEYLLLLLEFAMRKITIFVKNNKYF